VWKCCGGQAWKAELLFGEAGVGRDDMPRTLLSQPHVWVSRWRERWGAALRAVSKVSDLSNDVVRERVEGFWAECKEALSSSPNALWVNFDETPLWFSFRSRRTNVPRRFLKGKQPVRLGGKASLSRRRITVGLTISTDADLAAAVPVFVVFKAKADRRPASPAWADVTVPEGVALHWQPRAWMTEELVGEWVGLLYQARDRIFGPDREIVLVWDAFKAHLTDAIRILCAANNIRVLVIPRGLTSLLQGLDTHVNKAFKASCRAWWRRFIRGGGDAPGGGLKIQDFLQLVIDAAGESLSATVRKGPLQGMLVGCASFLHNGLTNDLDGSEDALINIRHRAVHADRRLALPAAAAAVGALAILPDADAGYGSEWSDSDGEHPDALLPSADDVEGAEGDVDEGDGEGVMRRIIVERDAWVNSLVADAEESGASPPRGFHGPPGQRRSSRRIQPARLKQDQCAGSAAAGGGARGSAG